MKNILRTLVCDGQVSLTVADTTEIVKESIQLHKLSVSSAETLGRALSAMTFMSACLKGERGEISLSVKSDGLGGDIGVSGNRALKLRGYIHNQKVTEGAEACWGKEGALTIIRDDGYSRPFVGACAFPTVGGLDGAFEEYFRISEQLPTRIATCVQMQGNECIFAGVVALQPLPFADQAALTAVEDCSIYDLLSSVQKQGIENAAKSYFKVDESVYELREAVYKCNCSREYLLGVLASLGERQMRQIIKEDGAVKVHCHYCSRDYEFTDKDADTLFHQG